jgi:hypothetical protein
VAIQQTLVPECPSCALRAQDVRRLRGAGGRGKQLGSIEREILRRAGASELRTRPREQRSGGLPLLREVFGPEPLRKSWDTGPHPSQPVVRAAAARLQAAGLVSLLQATRREAADWVAQMVGKEWPDENAVRRRLLLTNFCWRTLLGDALVQTYGAALQRAGSQSRLRWDHRLDDAHAFADRRCAHEHSEQAISEVKALLSSPTRLQDTPRR